MKYIAPFFLRFSTINFLNSPILYNNSHLLQYPSFNSPASDVSITNSNQSPFHNYVQMEQYIWIYVCVSSYPDFRAKDINVYGNVSHFLVFHPI